MRSAQVLHFKTLAYFCLLNIQDVSSELRLLEQGFPRSRALRSSQNGDYFIQCKLVNSSTVEHVVETRPVHGCRETPLYVKSLDSSILYPFGFKYALS